MNNLQTTLNTRMQQMGYDQFPGFYHSAKIVFHHEGKNRMHTFNYLWQEYALEKYLELNNLCIEFNDAFDYEKKVNWISEQMIRHLGDMGYSKDDAVKYRYFSFIKFVYDLIINLHLAILWKTITISGFIC